MNVLDGPIGRRVHRIYDVTADFTLSAPPEWALAAVCPSVDPEIFYPEKGGSVREAKRVCSGCPVRLECLTDAIAIEPKSWERFGVRGGLSPQDRTRLVAAGWEPGDEHPGMTTGRGGVEQQQGGHGPGDCEECGRHYARLDEHNKRRHGYLRGVA